MRLVTWLCSLTFYMSAVVCVKESLSLLFDDFVQWRFSDSPEFASNMGYHAYDHKLESYRLRAWRKRYVQVVEFSRRAEMLSRYTNDTNLIVFKKYLQSWLDGYKTKSMVFALSRIEGVHINFESVINDMRFLSYDDYNTYLRRLRALPEQINGIIEIMRYGVLEGITAHNSSMSGVVEQIEEQINQRPEDTIYYRPLLGVTGSIWARRYFQAAGKNIIKRKIQPAFERLKNFLKIEYLPNTRKDYGISSVNGGRELYKQCLKYHLGLDMTPEDVHKIGLKEIERIRKNILEVIAELKLDVTPKEFSILMRSNDSFILKSQEDVKRKYEDILYNQIPPKMSMLFFKKDINRLSVQLVDKSGSSGPNAFYLAGAGTRPGTYYVNANDLTRHPTYIIPSLAAHEGLPGHHLQSQWLQSLPNMPAWRTMLEDRKYLEMPTHFPINTAYLEGWALYAESLGHDLGIYQTPYERYGHYSQEMLRAGRLVVDTGIHAFGWDRSKAIDFLINNSASSLSEIENEIDRYIQWPGQACGYKIGEIQIRGLKHYAAKTLGERFDIREFHSVILNNFAPLDFIEKDVMRYIEEKLATGTALEEH